MVKTRYGPCAARSSFTSVGARDARHPLVAVPVGRGGHRIVQQMRPQLVPRLVHVIGDEHRRRSIVGRKLDEPGLVSVCATFVLVQLLQFSLVRLEDEPQPVLRRPLDRGFAAARQHDERSTGRRARRCDVDASAVEDHRLTLQQLPELRQLLVGEAAPSTHIDTEVVILFGTVPDAERV